MGKADRLPQVLQALRGRRGPTRAEVLAEALNVSPRTIYRDIVSLRAMGARIEGAAGFGYVLEEDPMLPPLQFTSDEIEALALGMSMVGIVADPELAVAAETVLTKVSAVAPESVRRRALFAVAQARTFRTRPQPGVDPALLRRAAWEERALDLHYVDVEGRETRRRVLPLCLAYLDESDVLIAWCRLREDFRTFRLDRMRSATMTDEYFRPRRVPMLSAYQDRMRTWRDPVDQAANPT